MFNKNKPNFKSWNMFSRNSVLIFQIMLKKNKTKEVQ